jgi:hypothetical protein
MYNLEDILEFCKTINKYKLKRKYKKIYNFLTENYDINNIEFLPKKKPIPKFTDEFIINITKDLKFRNELLTLYPDVYKYVKNKKYFKTICKHLISNSISQPQLILKFITDKLFSLDGELNNRKILKPYEIDVYYEKLKLGFEYNGNYWHYNNLNDIKKINLNKDITLIIIKETSKNYILDIKNQLIENLNILQKFNNLITEEIIQNINVDFNYLLNYDLDKYKQIAIKYKTKTEFKKNDYVIYNNCDKLNIMEIVGEHFIKYIYWDEISALNKASQYNNADELQNNYPGCYQFLLKNNLLNKVKYKIERLIYQNVNEEYLLNNFTSIQNLKDENYSLYKYLKRINDIINMLKYYDDEFILNVLNDTESLNDFRFKYNLIYKNSYIENQHKNFIDNYYMGKNYDKYFLLNFDIDKIKEICLKYNNITDFKKDYNKIYKYLTKNKLIDNYFEHLNTLKFRNNKLLN